MSKYNGPVCRFCRREGQKLFLKGERCLTEKCAYDRRQTPPGQHGAKRTKASGFAIQLREKQKLKRVYGVTEGPFRNSFEKAAAERGITSEIFFQRLELRLDNVVYRMGFAASRQDAKQVVRHNHILVNGKRMNIPSALMRMGDVISIADKSKKMTRFGVAVDLYKKRANLPWTEVDSDKLTGKIVALPTRADVHLDIKERLIVELYNK